MHLATNYWSLIINILLENYFSHLTTTCILWHHQFDLIFEAGINSNVLLLINPRTLNESFSKDIYNFTQQDEYFNGNQVFYNDWIKKYIAAIENTNCEGFLAFQDHIPMFAETFRKATVFSIWRSIYTRFLFAYVRDQQQEDYFQDILFINQANMLIVEADSMNSSSFALKTNKFVGSLSEHPEELKLISIFNALNFTFSPDINLYSCEKLQDLKGREIIVAALDYRPFVAVDFDRMPQYYDHAEDNLSHLVHVDGVETRLCHIFCELYNCTVEFNTSEKEEWGTSYMNYTGYGLIGMIMQGKVDMATGSMYAWTTDYMAVDVSNFIIRSGVTCLVPAPRRIVSWDLPIRPFQNTLWLIILSILVIESLALFLAKQFDQFLKNLQRQDAYWYSNYVFGFILTFKLFLNQSSTLIVKGHTLRMIMFACYAMDLMITSVYSGGLSAILTMPIMGEAADSVERLYEHNLIWAATSYEWVESIKDVDDNPIYQRLSKNFKTYKFPEIRKMAKTDNMAFALERLTYGHFGNLDFITPQALRHLKLMFNDIYYGHTVAMVARLWVHLPKYNDLILAWRSSGLDKFCEWKITAEYLNINEQNQVQASMFMNFEKGPLKLGMDNFGGIILLWLVGIAFSILVFLGELLMFKIKQRKLRWKLKKGWNIKLT